SAPAPRARWRSRRPGRCSPSSNQRWSRSWTPTAASWRGSSPQARSSTSTSASTAATPPARSSTHAPMTTALSCVLDGELPCVHYQMLLLGGSVHVAPYATFGTRELADGVLDALEGRNAALMANHGALNYAADLETAVENALLLEWACTVYWRAAAIGTPRALDETERHAVVAAAVERGYGTTRPASGEEAR